MNSKKTKLLCSIFTLLVVGILTMNFLVEESYAEPDYIYQVYLDGEKVGLINSKEALYSLINNEQKEIKEEYKVDQVYPPKGFQIIKTHTYNENLNSVENVYELVKNEREFTIKGYTITIKSGQDGVEPIYIYVLDKEIFRQAVEKYVITFIGEERYKQYNEKTQPEIVDVGYIIENMYFKDTISIKESYISVDQKIYTEVDDLAKYLLFGEGNERKEYTVVKGDTIESIAYANQLNTSELLIANEELYNEQTLLAIGQKLNVALINPVLSLVYEELVVEDVEQKFETIEEKDDTKYVDYKVEKQKGENGINRVTSRVQFTNGEQNQGVAFIGEPVVIKPVKNQIIVKGTKKYTTSLGGSGHYVDTGDLWGWPTNQPSVITSHYGYRWGTLHDGMDISGTGRYSPIYAILDGEVVSAQYGGMVGSSAGYNVVVRHANGYYSVYAHMQKGTIRVKVGDWVTRGQILGGMGDSGTAFGVHCHLGLFYGKPYHGGYSVDPRKIYNIR